MRAHVQIPWNIELNKKNLLLKENIFTLKLNDWPTLYFKFNYILGFYTSLNIIVEYSKLFRILGFFFFLCMWKVNENDIILF